MAKKERQKRSARKARAAERAALEAAQQASAQPADSKGKKSDAKAADAPKKSDKAAKSEKKKEKKPGRIRTYFREVRAEMHRVVWPDRQELKSYSIAVIVTLIVFGVCVWLVDTGFVALLAGFTSLGVK